MVARSLEGINVGTLIVEALSGGVAKESPLWPPRLSVGDEGSMLKVQGLRVQGLGCFRIHE